MPENNTTEEQTNTRFQNIEAKQCHCFGGYHQKNSWLDIAQQSIENGWKNIDVYQLESSLAEDVSQSYMNIATLELTDLATEVTWVAKYVNDKSLWKLEIKDSPSAEILDEDKQAFFTSQSFLKILRECGDLLDKALTKYNDIVNVHLEKAELLEVDEVKLSALLYWLNDKMFMENFRSGKYIF